MTNPVAAPPSSPLDESGGNGSEDKSSNTRPGHTEPWGRGKYLEIVFCLITFLRPVAKESRREKYWPTATTAGTYLVMNRNDSLTQQYPKQSNSHEPQADATKNPVGDDENREGG